MSSSIDPIYQILEEIHTQPKVSQRSLAANLGIALGLTNSLVRGLVRRGWVRATRISPHRVSYLLTPAGIVEKTRLSHAAFQGAVERYRVARMRVEGTFRRASTSWEGETVRKPVVFYGSGEVAEIGFICLQETDLELIAVIDDCGRERFFGVPVYDRQQAAQALETSTGDARLLVMSLARTEEVEAHLATLGPLGRRAIWI